MNKTEIPIYTLSGTGNTLAVAKKMAEEFQNRGVSAKVIPMTHQTSPESVENSEWIGIAAPIYGFGVSDIVIRFIKKLPKGKGKKVFICLSAGDGDKPVNRNAAEPLRRTLKRKGYHIPYIRYFTMPANWTLQYPETISKKLYIASMEKAVHSVNDILKGVIRKMTPSVFIRLLAPLVWFGEEKIGAHLYGRFLKAGKDCTLCGRCVRECPAGNITRIGDKIRFSWKCVWCMKCVYNCPDRAIYPRLFKFSVFKEPYNLNKIVKETDENSMTADEEKKCRHFLPYLNNIEK